MDNIQLLIQLGLNKQESKVYLALLGLGESSVQKIARQAGVQRPNCYALLDSLIRHGLVSYSHNKRGRTYVAGDPSTLTRIHQQRTITLNTLLPNLRTLYSQSPIHTKIRTYEGREGIKQVYEEILESDGYDCIYSPDVLLPIWGDYSATFGIKAAKKGLKIRELILIKNPPVDYAKHFKKPLQEIRYLSSEKKIATDMVIFENKLVLVAYEPDIHAVVIEGSNIVDTQLALFEIIWKRASTKPL